MTIPGPNTSGQLCSRLAAVNRQCDAGDVRRLLTGKEQDGIGYFFCGSHTTCRNHIDEIVGGGRVFRHG